MPLTSPRAQPPRPHPRPRPPPSRALSTLSPPLPAESPGRASLLSLASRPPPPYSSLSPLCAPPPAPPRRRAAAAMPRPAPSSSYSLFSLLQGCGPGKTKAGPSPGPARPGGAIIAIPLWLGRQWRPSGPGPTRRPGCGAPGTSLPS